MNATIAPPTPRTRPLRSGLLLVNLGSPLSTSTGDVRRYLREFLWDPRVLDIPPVARALLLNLVILPFRPARSAAAYRKIWTEQGSPLIVFGRGLAEAVQKQLGDAIPVELAMRYSRPSIREGLIRLRERGAERIVVFPLYPQYASSSTGTVLEAVYTQSARLWNVPDIATVAPFYEDPGFLESFVEVAHPRLDAFRPDHVLMSFHGLPERHVKKSDMTDSHCLAAETCCDRIVDANRYCYRAQCFATARGLARGLDLAPDRTTVSFQSRLGRTPWIRPHTDILLNEFPARGIKRVAVLCPSFVADCLETLEEIGIRGREQFRNCGGEDLILVPCPNEHPALVENVVQLVREHLG
jgi:ferrochelatase